MAEYIGKGATIAMVQWIMSDSPSITWEDWDAIVDALLGIPPADVHEVKRGTWIKIDDAYNRIAGRCSSCGWEAHLYEDDVVGMPFCPNCGAYMKGESDG